MGFSLPAHEFHKRLRILTEDAEADKNFKKNPCRDIKLSNVHPTTASCKSGSVLKILK
jgi:hypothetical protein